jgi:hypothetical protein
MKLPSVFSTGVTPVGIQTIYISPLVLAMSFTLPPKGICIGYKEVQ